MVITKSRRERIVLLANALAEIAPSTTRGKRFCVQKVAEESGLKACWKKQSNKRKDIAHLLNQVLRKYRRSPPEGQDVRDAANTPNSGPRWGAPAVHTCCPCHDPKTCYRRGELCGVVIHRAGGLGRLCPARRGSISTCSRCSFPVSLRLDLRMRYRFDHPSQANRQIHPAAPIPGRPVLSTLAFWLGPQKGFLATACGGEQLSVGRCIVGPCPNRCHVPV